MTDDPNRQQFKRMGYVPQPEDFLPAAVQESLSRPAQRNTPQLQGSIHNQYSRQIEDYFKGSGSIGSARDSAVVDYLYEQGHLAKVDNAADVLRANPQLINNLPLPTSTRKRAED